MKELRKIKTEKFYIQINYLEIYEKIAYPLVQHIFPNWHCALLYLLLQLVHPRHHDDHAQFSNYSEF